MNEVIRLNGRRVPGFALGDSSSTILQPGWRYLGIVQTPRGWSANQLNKLLEQNGWTDEATGTEPSLAADGLSLGFTISAVWNGGIEPMPSQVDPFVQDVIYVPPFETWDASEEDKGNWTIKSGTSALGEPDTIRQAGENMILLNGKPVRGFGVGDDVSTPPPSYVPPHPTPVVVKALAAGAVGAIAGAGMSYADARRVSGSAVSYGAVIGAMGALVATALK